MTMIKNFSLLSLCIFLLTSCEAENETLAGALFDQSTGGGSIVSGSLNMRSGSVRIDDTVYFYDSGGISANYGNSQNHVLTVYPANAGDRVTLSLEYFSIENSDGCVYDSFEVFNGTSTSAPRLDLWCGDGDSFWIPFYFIASNSSGALTIRFKSDGSSTSVGWNAILFPLPANYPYQMTTPRAVGLTGSSSRLNYSLFGPSTLPTDQGFCISTTNTLPSRTNGASCFTASVNRYGTRVFSQPAIAANQTHYMRAFHTPPGAATVYSSTVSYVPMFKTKPDLLQRFAEIELFVPEGPLN